MIASTSFGINVDSFNNPNDPFVKNTQNTLKFDFLDLFLFLISMSSFILVGRGGGWTTILTTFEAQKTLHLM